MDMKMNVIELRNNPRYKYHHSASRRGYLSRKSNGIVEPYKGRFGEGYIVITPRFDTTSYVTIEYYINHKKGV